MTEVRTSIAARVARLHPQRLNEAIAAGHVPSAPTTSKGSARVFQDDDLLGLFIYARLIGFKIERSVAGGLAAAIVAKGQRHPGEAVLVLRSLIDGTEVHAASTVAQKGFTMGAGHTPAFTMTFDLEHLRAVIAKDLAYELENPDAAAS